MSKLRALVDPRAGVVRRVMAAKRARVISPESYTDHPTVSLILRPLDHRANIELMIDRLRRTAAEELIVCEDGSINGFSSEWLSRLTRPNEFLVRSKGAHEVRVYIRAVGLARGEFVCVLQDQDVPPADREWVKPAVALFRRYPMLAILGQAQRGVPLPFADPTSGAPFMFVQAVGIGPIFYRREVLLTLGGFNRDFSPVGESAISFRQDICLRAWQAGWHVGLFAPAALHRSAGEQGTAGSGSSPPRQGDRVETLVDELNRGLASRADACR